MDEFKVGDRVTLVQDDCWKQPFQKFSDEQRGGTIKEVFGSKIPPKNRSYLVEFDVKRKNAKPVVNTFYQRDLKKMEDQ